MSRRSLALLTVGLLLASVVAGAGIFPVAAASDPPQVEDAIAFTDVDGQFSAGDVLVEVRFDRSVNETTVDPAEVVVRTRSGGALSVDSVLSGAVTEDRQFLLNLGPASAGLSPSVVESIAFADGATIETANGTAFDGSAIENASVTATTTTLTEGTDNPDRAAFRGETVAIVGDQANEGLFVESLRGNDVVKLISIPDDGQVYALNTTGLAFDRYTLVFDGDTTADLANGRDDDGDGDLDEDRLLELWNFTMDLRVKANPNVDDATVTESENVTGTVETNAANEPLAVVVRGDDGEIFRRSTLVTNGSGVATFDFAPIELDEADDHFSVIATHTTSGAVAFERIKVSEVDHDAGFATGSVTEERGDVVDIPIVLSPEQGDRVAVDRATVTIGGPDVGYRANVTVSDWNDDQRVLLHWNTYAADGYGGAIEFWAEPTDPEAPDDSVSVLDVSTTVAGGPTDVLDAGLYEIQVRSGADAADEPANATAGVLLTGRSTDAVRVWRAPTDRDVPLETLEDLREAMADGTLTGTSTVAGGDRALFAIHASGIEGALETGPDANATAAFESFLGSGAVLSTVQTNPGPNRAATVIDLSAPGTTRVLTDAPNDTYYLVVDLGAVPIARDVDGDGTVSVGDPGTRLEDGDRFETRFEIPETDGGLAAEDEAATVNWTYVAADASVNRTRIDGESVALVEPASGQTISGSATVAPGTSLRLTVRDDADDVTFLHTREVAVDANGTWASEFNFSDVPNGTAFTVTVERGDALLATADGLVHTRPNRLADTDSSTTAAERSSESHTHADRSMESTTHADRAAVGDVDRQNEPRETVSIAISRLSGAADGRIPLEYAGPAVLALLLAVLVGIRLTR
ncbi:MAG: BGTF surface domain-containing protein [Halanaeroarchaeum sp.]